MSSKKTIVVGTRESQLARVQTDSVIATLKTRFPDKDFQSLGITSKGDQVLDKPLSKIGGKGLFTKELEEALADGRVDMVVHSLKDLPSTLPDGMLIGAVCEREDRRDALVMASRHEGKQDLAALPHGAVVGTSSMRRVAQVHRQRPDLQCRSVRGNLNTRLRKLDAESGEFDALMLAAAGMDRLGWQSRVTHRFSPATFMYAAGQGAIAVEVRAGDQEVISLVETLTHRDTLVMCAAERAFLKALGGGCSVPIGVHTEVESNGTQLSLDGAVFNADGTECRRHRMMCTLSEEGKSAARSQSEQPTGLHVPKMWLADVQAAAGLGAAVAEVLITQGASEILEQVRAAGQESQQWSFQQDKNKKIEKERNAYISLELD